MNMYEYQAAAMSTAVYPFKETGNLTYCLLKLFGEVGELYECTDFRSNTLQQHDLVIMLERAAAAAKECEATGKYGRDKDSSIFPSIFIPLPEAEAAKKEVGDILWYLAAICEQNGWTLDECAAMNLEKLASRKERNQLHGSGDNR